MSTSQSVLITCSRLVDLAGSELTTLELAEAFVGMGWVVAVASFEVSTSMLAQVESLGAHFINLSDSQGFASHAEFELAWLHHSVTAYRVLTDEALILRKVIFSSLSHFNPLECPPLSVFRLSRYVLNSQENLEHLLAHYPEFSHAAVVMNNSVPARFWQKSQATGVLGALRSLVIVSNHPPAEVLRIAELGAEAGIRVDHLGAEGRQVRVTPNILRNYDAVITIGKTVQYAIAAQVPVYCYDHFGGEGWVTPETFQHGRRYNFSGRGGRGRVSAEQLFQELLDGYAQACETVGRLCDLGRQHFELEGNISAVLQGVLEYVPPAISKTDTNVLARGVGVFTDLRDLITYRDELANVLRKLLLEEKKNAVEQISYRDDLIADLQGQLDAEKRNAVEQIDYRKQLATELQSQLNVAQARAARLEARLGSRKELLKLLLRAKKENEL